MDEPLTFRAGTLLLALALGCGMRATPTGVSVAPAAPLEAIPASVARTLVPGSARASLPPGPAHLVLSNGSAGDVHVAVTASATRRLQAVGPAPRRFEGPPGRLDPAPAPGGTMQALASTAVGDGRAFWVCRITSGEDRPITAHAVLVGAHTEVWVDDALGAGLDAGAAALGRTFDTAIYPTDVRLFGAPVAPAGASAHVLIVISPAVDGGGADDTAGFTYTRDLGAPRAGTATAHSNQGLLMYLAPAFLASGDRADLLATSAHELEHLINTSGKLLGGATPVPAEVSWLDEALAMYAMQANGYGLGTDAALAAEHVKAFQANPGAYSLTDWARNPDATGYGAGYLFMAYLAGRFGEGLVHELAHARQRGTANLDARLASRHSSFAGAFRDWAIANARPRRGTDPRFRYAGLAVDACHAEALDAPGVQDLAMLPWSASYLDVTGTALAVSAGGGLSAMLLAP